MKNISNKIDVNRKQLKKSGLSCVRSHYWFLLVTCLIAAFVGSEFSDALTLTSLESDSLVFLSILPSSVVESGSQIFGLTHGVFASIVSSFANGTIYDTFYTGINSIIGSELASLIILIILSMLASFIFWLFVGNIFSVISRRIFLESRVYDKVSHYRFLFLFYIKKWPHVTFVMFLQYFFNMLWYLLLIVPGIIKHYSYFLVPYILAENPSLSAKDTITLSRKMMYGHKFECFKLDLSFLGWTILRVFSLGLSGLFFSNSYQTATYTEYYVKLRDLAKENKIPNSYLLNDTYLYEKADKEVLSKTYSDVLVLIANNKAENIKPSNIFERILNFFGITLRKSDETGTQKNKTINESKSKTFDFILNKKQYPSRLFTIEERFLDFKSETTDYMRRYTIPSLILMFFIFAFIGWTWEVVLSFIVDGKFVNRGTMHGPWLPIYGSGGLLILTVLYNLRKKPIVMFFSAIALCGVIEYFTAYFLELAHDGEKWWDYTGYFLNLHGRICAEGLLVFGLAGIAVVYVLAPLLVTYINKINYKAVLCISSILVVIFAADLIYSAVHPNAGEGITATNVQSSNIHKSDNPLYNNLIL